MVESVLRSAGYRTGLYTSPHLHTFRERIQTSGALIPETDVARLVDGMKPLVAQVADITTFEVMTVLAFAWFAEQGVEWAVVEVGLGGRLDATNVLVPAVAVITSLSYDHTAILGETLAQIAAEKAGIVKPGVPVVSAPQSAEALSVIEEICSQREAPLTLVGREWRWELGTVNLDGQAFALTEGQRVIDDLWTPLLGEHQVVNATTAVAALSLLRRSGTDLSHSVIRDGLRAVHWPGRLEILGRAPLVVADAAHNGDSAQKLVAALRDYCDYRRMVVVWGASADHATPGLMAALLSGADRAIAARTRHPRAADPSWLQAQAAKAGFCLEVKETVAEALNAALDEAGPEDLICCTGSVFVAAEARETWFARQGMPPLPFDPA
jgi:dihydrofolate synthase/folylpolyglutamate synthase